MFSAVSLHALVFHCMSHCFSLNPEIVSLKALLFLYILFCFGVKFYCARKMICNSVYKNYVICELFSMMFYCFSIRFFYFSILLVLV